MVFGKYGTDIEERVNYERLRIERLQKAREQVSKDGLGALVTWDPDSIRYIAAHFVTTPLRFGQMQFVVLPRNGDPVLFCGGIASEYRRRMPWLKGKVYPAWALARYALTPDDLSRWVQVIGDILAEHGLTKEPLGLEGTTSEFLFGEAFKRVGINAVDSKNTMLEVRKIKTKDEIELMRITSANSDEVFAALRDAIRPGVRECDLVGIAMKLLYELGDDHTEDLVCCSGEHTNPFDVSFTDRPIRPGDLVYIDVDGCSYQGYKTCVYRTFCCGKATTEQKEIYEVGRSMLYDGMIGIKAGNTTADIAKKWPDSPSFWGYDSWEEVMALAVGHGIGLCLHERPFISLPQARENPIKLEENMVLALETWYGNRGGKDGVRLEEDIVITKDGYELLTKFPIDELMECWT